MLRTGSGPHARDPVAGPQPLHTWRRIAPLSQHMPQSLDLHQSESNHLGEWFFMMHADYVALRVFRLSPSPLSALSITLIVVFPMLMSKNKLCLSIFLRIPIKIFCQLNVGVILAGATSQDGRFGSWQIDCIAHKT